MYELITSADTLPSDQIDHTFPDVDFFTTTTYALTKTGRRKKRGHKVKTRTATRLDPCKLQDLSLQAAARQEELDEEARQS